MLSVLEAGGDAAADAIIGVLEDGVEMLEQHSAASPRKLRRAVRDVTDRAESLAESVDAGYCDGMSACAAEDLVALGDALATAERKKGFLAHFDLKNL